MSAALNPLVMPASTSTAAIALRVPPLVRGHSGRPVPPAVPLLPAFIAGQENRFAAFVATAPLVSAEAVGAGEEGNGLAAAELGLIGMGPLLLVGPSGCGKTALATHLATRMNEQVADQLAQGDRRGPQLLLMPGVDFARAYARAVDADDIGHFRRDLDQAAVLVIDDVHLMVGKPASQDELASRIETRTVQGRPTILTCRRLPTQVPGLRPLLVSRMLPGLTVPIRPPGPEARRVLLQEFARRRKLPLGDDELELLATGLAPDLPARQLAAALAQVELYCRMKRCAPDVHAVRAAIGATQSGAEVSTDQVAKVISRRYKVKLADLKSGSRRQEIVRARSLAMYLARQLTGSSYHQIGKYFGGRDHTTVLHACRKTEGLLGQDGELRVAVDEVADQLKATA